jgi:hypothetical protein
MACFSLNRSGETPAITRSGAMHDRHTGFTWRQQTFTESPVSHLFPQGDLAWFERPSDRPSVVLRRRTRHDRPNNSTSVDTSDPLCRPIGSSVGRSSRPSLASPSPRMRVVLLNNPSANKVVRQLLVRRTDGLSLTEIRSAPATSPSLVTAAMLQMTEEVYRRLVSYRGTVYSGAARRQQSRQR